MTAPALVSPGDLATVLAALDDAAGSRRERLDCASNCPGCALLPDGRCEDHAADEASARVYDDLAGRLLGASR